MCIKNCIKVFLRGVSITDPEGASTVTTMILEGGTAEKKFPLPPPQVNLKWNSL